MLCWVNKIYAPTELGPLLSQSCCPLSLWQDPFYFCSHCGLDVLSFQFYLVLQRKGGLNVSRCWTSTTEYLTRAPLHMKYDIFTCASLWVPHPQCRITWWKIAQDMWEVCGISVSVTTVDDVIPLGSSLSAFPKGWNADKLPNTTVTSEAVISLLTLPRVASVCA